MDEDIIRIVDGLRYDTLTATAICTFRSQAYQSDFRYEDTGLFRTPRGHFFLAGYGGPRTRWARQEGNDTSGGRGVIPIDVVEARTFAEQHADAEDVARFFAIEEA